MPAIVQATCPGCKKVLRIPAEWMKRPIRCKHCGMTLNARPHASPAASPEPAARPASVKPTKERREDPRPDKSKRPASVRQAEAAEPVFVEPVTDGSPFESLEDSADRPRRRRRGISASVIVIAACLLLLLSGASVGVFLWFGRSLLLPVAEKNEEVTPGKEPVSTEVIKDSGPAAQPQPEVDTWDRRVPFPRRALLISVHNYLFANPVGAGLPTQGSRKISGLPDKLNTGLRIPFNQIVHLSDVAPAGHARPPLKPVIEKTLSSFLDSSRPQDRVMVFFIGHAVESADGVYLVPMEGELDKPETLLSLKTVYDKLAACSARQKVLVMDVCRLNPVVGAERPGGEAMGQKLAETLATPPPGVQVWSACGAEQHSYETEDEVMGVFLDKLQTSLERASEGKLKLQEHIQKPDDLIPLDRLSETVNELIAKQLQPLKLKQISHLTGRPPDSGASFDAKEPQPPAPTVAAAPPPLPAKYQAELRELLADIAVPPIKHGSPDDGLDFRVLPPFSPARLEAYAGKADGDSELRTAVRKTQILLYAVSGTQPPPKLAKEVKDVAKTLKSNLTVVREGYRKRAENDLKNQIMRDERAVAPILARLGEAYEDLKAAGEKRDAEPKRWQANYDFMLARLEGQLAYVWEYQSMLGQIRREVPALEEGHGGWKLAATPTLSGDSNGKKLASSSRKLLDKIIKEHGGTPWEVVAKREQLTALGLEWKSAK